MLNSLFLFKMSDEDSLSWKTMAITVILSLITVYLTQNEEYTFSHTVQITMPADEAFNMIKNMDIRQYIPNE